MKQEVFMIAQLKEARNNIIERPELFKSRQQNKKDKDVREHVREQDIDKDRQDSFPASDPPGRY